MARVYGVLVGLMAAMLLAACATPEQRAAFNASIAQRQVREVYAPRCQAFGYEPGTNEFAGCVERLATQDNGDAARAQAAAAAALIRATQPPP